MSAARVAIIGSGSIGLFLGAVLSRVTDVTIFGREGAPAAGTDGIRLEGEREGLFLPRQAASWGELAGLEDAPLIIATKAYQVGDVLAALGRHGRDRGARRPVWFCQNGLGILDEAARAAPAGNWGRLCCWLGTGADRARGVVRVAGVSRIELAGAGLADREELARWLRAAEIPADILGGVAELEWRKSLWNIAFNGVCAIADVPNGAPLDDPELLAATDLLLEEAVQVARAEGVAVPADYRARVHAGARATASNYCSTVLDRRAGRRTELDWLNGEVIRRAEARGIPVPANQALIRNSVADAECSPRALPPWAGLGPDPQV